ncbi:MAG: glycosyltransferase family 4 protein [Chloroflexi bacterium]|nr:glycosyltransferase family 4 protein [Chloroflexota bacterium]
MTIYLDVAAAVHGRAGLGRYAESLTRALVAQRPGEFALFYNDDPTAQPLAGLEAVPTRRVRAGYKPWRMAVWAGQALRLPFNRLLPEATLYHATEHLLLPLANVPTVLTVHDLIFHRFPQYHKRLNYWYLRLTMPLYVRRASAVVAVSQATRNDLVELYGTPPAKIHVIHEAAAPQFRPASPQGVASVRERYALPQRFLLTVGTVEPRKNLPGLLRALHRLTDVSLVAAGGTGWLPEETFRTCEELGLGDRVRWLGYVPDADLPALYSAADAVALPSFYEGFGLPVLEAMSCGAPVLCSRSSSLPEVGGDAARYFDPHQPAEMAAVIDQVWADESLRSEMRAAALRRAAGFSWGETARQTYALYQALLKA